MSLSTDFPEVIKSGLEFRRPTRAANDYGELVKSYPVTADFSVSGVLRQLSGNEIYAASMHGYEADYRVYVDAPADIIEGDRMTYDGVNYDVVRVNDVMQTGEMLQIDLKRVTEHGQFSEGS